MNFIGSRDHLPDSVLLGLLLYVTQKFVLRSPKARKLDARYARHCICQIVVIKNLLLQCCCEFRCTQADGASNVHILLVNITILLVGFDVFFSSQLTCLPLGETARKRLLQISSNFFFSAKQGIGVLEILLKSQKFLWFFICLCPRNSLLALRRKSMLQTNCRKLFYEIRDRCA